MKKIYVIGLFAILFMTLACEPVIAIGWKEFLFISLIIAILFGPPLYRFLRRIEDFRRYMQKKK